MNRAILVVSLSVTLALAAGFVDAKQAKPVPGAAAKAGPSEADSAFAAWDIDHNATLSRQEFVAGWEQLRRATQVQARLRQQFANVDADKSDAIEQTEYANLILIREAGKSAPPLSSFDANSDGRLQLGEYLTMVRTLVTRQTAKDKAK